MTTQNTVKYGLSNVHVFPITNEDSESIEYGEPIRIPGAVTLEMEAQGETEKFYADNIAYFITNTNAGYAGTLEIATISEEFEVKIMDNQKDKNGAIIEKADARPKTYAIAFEFDGDKHKVRHVFYKCSSTRPGISGHTNEETTTPQTDTLNIAAAPRLKDKVVRSKVKEGQEGYDTFYKAPYEIVAGLPEEPEA